MINEGDGQELCVSMTGEGEYQGLWARVVNKGGRQEQQMKAMDEGKGFVLDEVLNILRWVWRHGPGPNKMIFPQTPSTMAKLAAPVPISMWFFHTFQNVAYQPFLLGFSLNTSTTGNWTVGSCCLYSVPLVWYRFYPAVHLIPCCWSNVFPSSPPQIIYNHIYSVSSYPIQYLGSQKCNPMYSPCFILKLDWLIWRNIRFNNLIKERILEVLKYLRIFGCHVY